MRALLIAASLCMGMATSASAQPSGTLVTCLTLRAVDGDTINCDGVLMRDMGDGAPFVSGYDTPEISNRKCQAELALGRRAKARMSELLHTKGLQIIDSGRLDATRTKRPLIWIFLPKGRSVGSILLNEGLARRWTPDYEADWCHGADDRADTDY